MLKSTCPWKIIFYFLFFSLGFADNRLLILMLNYLIFTKPSSLHSHMTKLDFFSWGFLFLSKASTTTKVQLSICCFWKLL